MSTPGVWPLRLLIGATALLMAAPVPAETWRVADTGSLRVRSPSALGGTSAWVLSAPAPAAAPASVSSQDAASLPPEFNQLPAPDLTHTVTATTVVSGLDNPWDAAFAPDGRIFITERRGTLRVVRDGGLDPEPYPGLPTIREVGQGGLLGIALHPQFAVTGWIYISYAEADPAGGGHRLAVARFQDTPLGATNFQVLFRGDTVNSGQHFGSRLGFAGDGMLYITAGDRGDQTGLTSGDPTQHVSQRLDRTSGKIHRIHPDGTIPADNPFVDTPGARPEIWSLGHRNPQGLQTDIATRRIWSTEHGPQGGDEVNPVRRGANYGWPVISHGQQYGGGRIGEGTAKAGLQQPQVYFTPSLAVSDVIRYRRKVFRHWVGDLLVAYLQGGGGLLRLDLDGTRVVAGERIALPPGLGRIRDVSMGPDGLIYLLTDSDAPNGRLIRLSPAS